MRNFLLVVALGATEAWAQGASGGGAAGTIKRPENGAAPQDVGAAIFDLALSVKAFGAAGDGIKDDTAAFQAAFAAAKDTPSNLAQAVYLPKGKYRITDSIDATGGRGWIRGWHVYGAGQGAIIDCQLPTGKPYPCLDFTGASQEADISGFAIYGEQAGSQTSGLLLGRSANFGNGSDSPHVSDLKIYGYFSKAPLAIISADEADVSKSYIATNSNAPALVFQGPADSLGVGSEYQKFNSSNDAFTLGTYHNDDLLYYGAGGTDSAPNAAFRFDSCTGAVDVSHSYAGDANASGSVAAIEIVGSAAVLIQDGFRAENNVRSGTENFFVHASGAGGIFGGSFHGLIVNSIASNYVVWHLLNGALIGGLQGDAHSNAPGVTWTGGDGTGRFMANTIILAPTGKWGTFDGVRSWGNQISTNDGIAPYPQYSPTSGLSSAIVAQPASLDLYGQRIEFWISNVPSCWMSAAAGASLGCMNTRGDFTAHEDLVAGRSVNTPAINNGAIPVGTAVVGTNGNSQFVAQAGTIGNSTTGTAAGLAAQYIDWNAGSGGTSIKNKPTLWAPYVQPSDPGCTTIGSVWFNTAASTTAMNVCMSVAGALQWVAK